MSPSSVRGMTRGHYEVRATGRDPPWVATCHWSRLVPPGGSVLFLGPAVPEGGVSDCRYPWVTGGRVGPRSCREVFGFHSSSPGPNPRVVSPDAPSKAPRLSSPAGVLTL